jgi:hypothetical protein
VAPMKIVLIIMGPSATFFGRSKIASPGRRGVTYNAESLEP